MVRIRIRRRPARAGLLATTFGLAVLSAIAGTAAASGSIRNGLIAYSRIAGDDVSIIVSRPDGSERRVLDLAQSGFLPSWSPDGRTLLLTTFLPDTLRPVLVNPTTGDTRILEVLDADREIALLCRAWTPNGKTLVCQGDSYSAAHPEVNGIYTIRAADGSHFKRLTFDAFPPIFGDEGTCGGGDQPGSVSPGGDRFVFTRTKCGTLPAPDRDQTAALFVMPLDGGHARQITPYGVPWSHEEGLAKWSPDGRRILFGTADGTLVTIRPDGSISGRSHSRRPAPTHSRSRPNGRPMARGS